MLEVEFLFTPNTTIHVLPFIEGTYHIHSIPVEDIPHAVSIFLKFKVINDRNKEELRTKTYNLQDISEENGYVLFGEQQVPQNCIEGTIGLYPCLGNFTIRIRYSTPLEAIGKIYCFAHKTFFINSQIFTKFHTSLTY